MGGMVNPTLLSVESPLAERQPKTDRLILTKELKDAAADRRLSEAKLQAAHAVLLRWANLELSGRLAELNETQMQGDFLAQVFGEALEYAGPLDGQEVWHREQHRPIAAGETPDAVLGFFRKSPDDRILAVVELKGPSVHLDRHRSNGRTAVGQCWDYLVNTPPECRWGIVSNIISFRLYERSSTKRRYEHFTLQALRDFETFKQFYVLFHRRGLIDASLAGPPTAVCLLQRSLERQREVGDKLYEAYSDNRNLLIQELHLKRKIPLDRAIEMAQRLIDRIVFIAFCEDRRLLPERIIAEAYKVAGIHAVTNPRWQSFKNLFRSINVGNPAQNIQRFNGGLFDAHPCDELELDDSWTNFFQAVGNYDFADEVNLDVLGHLFERSITEIEKLRISGLFGDKEKAEQYARMPQSAKRKQLGTYYTPPELTALIVKYTVDELIAERFAAVAVEFGISAEDAARGAAPDDRTYWERCLAVLRNLKILDPACGSGAFLFQAYEVLEDRYHAVIDGLSHAGMKDAEKLAAQIPTFILRENLYGVDLSHEAVEIAQLALWIRSAARGQLLEKLSDNIIRGNSLVHDPAVHPLGFDWKERFPAVFQPSTPKGTVSFSSDEKLNSPPREPGFDCIIGNPPWERIKLQEREFFSLPAPEIATAANAAKRRKMVAKLETENPALYQSYQEALASADSMLTYCRTSGEYPLTGKGDINTYAVFAELAYRLVAPKGRVGLLVPSGIASDMTTKDFFAAVADSNRLIRLYDFENKKNFFPDVHASFKFSIINYHGEGAKTPQADFVFFAHRVEELDDPKCHIPLSGADIRLLNPNTRTCPIFRTRRRENHQGHLPPRADFNRPKPPRPDRQPLGHPVQDDVPSNKRRRVVPRGRHTQGRRVQAQGQSLGQGQKGLFAALRGQDGAGLRPSSGRYLHRPLELGPSRANRKAIVGRLSESRTIGHAEILDLARGRIETMRRIHDAFSLLQGCDKPDEPTNDDCGNVAVRRHCQFRADCLDECHGPSSVLPAGQPQQLRV